MKTRIVETIATAGSLSDTAFAIDASKENVSLDYNAASEDLAILDYNLNYNALPWQLGDDLVKKVFLTYNGASCTSSEIIQTILAESSPLANANQEPGYNNSNEWIYKPSEFQRTDLPTTSDPCDTRNLPYDQSEGFTITKQFLTAESNIAQLTTQYRYPSYHEVIPANTDDSGTRIYKDGWYTSYVIACKTWDSADPVNNGVAIGQVVYYPLKEEFYINTTGTASTLVNENNDASLPLIPDPEHWTKGVSFEQWMEFLRNNMGKAMTNDPVYFVENQHLVTCELQEAVKKELLKIGSCCDKPEFGMSHIEMWMKLKQKLIASATKFKDCNFKAAQKILESSRATCYMCLYHNGENLNLC